jgi:hypothetical protein
MNQTLINRTLNILHKLPDFKVAEVADFADFMLKRYEEASLTHGIEQLISESKAFEFLKNEEEIYTLDDLKERY